jgi:dTDP-glucose 4,6-dehydratase
MSERVLITGGCGFVGHHVVEHVLKNTDWDVVVVDRLNYASSGFDRLRDIEAFDDRRVTVLAADFTKPIVDGLASEIGPVDYILHLGAETHVDRSIEDPEPFVMANVVGTMHVLNFARTLPALKRMIYFSTDEVFGPAPVGTFYKEWDRYNSGNPYAAAKAGGEELSLAYANTYGVPVMVTHSMNIFGERQHPEKFIPMCIRKIRAGETVTIHSDKTRTVSGSRCWIHARNVADALLFLLPKGDVGDKYNIVGPELSNADVARVIAKALDKALYTEFVDFHSSRPGHDLRYALDGTKMAEMGWDAPVVLRDSLTKVVEWTVAHPCWLEVA